MTGQKALGNKTNSRNQPEPEIQNGDAGMQQQPPTKRNENNF